MRIDPDACRDPDLLAAEVRRLRAVIAAGEPVLTDDERAAIRWIVGDDLSADGVSIQATLRGLLERLK